jgi:predicted alpha/beta hydrolase
MHRPSLVELFGPGYIVSCFRDLAAAVGSRWCGVRGQITPEVVRDLDHRHRHPRSHTTSPAVIDLASLEAALDRVSPLAASQPADDAVAIHPLFTAAPV